MWNCVTKAIKLGSRYSTTTFRNAVAMRSALGKLQTQMLTRVPEWDGFCGVIVGYCPNASDALLGMKVMRSHCSSCG